MYASDARHPKASLEDKLAGLYSLNREKTIHLGFRPYYINLLRALGNPHLGLPPVIHVAGTNGKGSTIAFLRSMLENAGYSVHAYTSPHLQRFNERIVLNGRMIDDEPLEQLLDDVLRLNGNAPVTFFEITTALAFTAFTQVKADVLLLETGLGGRLDCTNIIENPAACVITSVGYDHMEFLGRTLHEIAAEKAGIIKRHAPCVIGHLGAQAVSAGVSAVFEGVLKSNESKGFIYGADWFTEPGVDQFRFVFDNQEFIFPIPSLPGRHQIQNAGSALATLKVLENHFSVSPQHKAAGLLGAAWPARLQKITQGKLPAIMPAGWQLWLDGGHNADAGDALAAQIDSWKTRDKVAVHVILGMMQHKDHKAFAAQIAKRTDSLRTINIPGEPGAAAAEDLAADIEATQACPDLESAIRQITAHSPPGIILVAGSLYLAGHVLNINGFQSHNQK